MEFLTGSKLRRAILDVLASSEPHCAVAFWGRGADTWLNTAVSPNTKIICNLSMGGTNPNVIATFPRHCVRQHEKLHAKVYLSTDTAVVASSNASANGLGLEGLEQSGWEEAGIKIQAPAVIRDIHEWFGLMWDKSKTIKDSDLESARIAWKTRQGHKPMLPSFKDFDLDAQPLPLITWLGNLPWSINEPGARKSLGYYNKSVEHRIDNGVEVEGPMDRKVLIPGTWVLNWCRDRQGLPSLNSKRRPWWARVEQIIDNAWFAQGDEKPRSIALGAEHNVNLFNLDEEHFCALFRRQMEKAQYKCLREDDYEGAWFTLARRKLMYKFWHELKSEYLHTPPAVL